MGYYGRSTSASSNLAKMLNCLIAFTLMAGLCFAAIPSFLVANRGSMVKKGDIISKQAVANSIQVKKRLKGISGNPYSNASPSPSVVETTKTALVQKIPPREKTDSEQEIVQE